MSEDVSAQLTEFQVGSLLAGYRLERHVGAGGMAVVFRARDERLGRPVALKILSPSHASDSEFRRRFIAESAAAAAVDDPHIIPVYEAGEADGVLFIAMRYVAGGDLRHVLQREGVLPPDRAADFVSQVASALDAAHGAGLVHRDVKPGNILVDTRRGRPDHVYLSDFGIVRRITAERLTRVGTNVGTPDYMAPEQIAGQDVDGRADQYSLACVTVQLLTGAVPFERDQLPALIYAHLTTPPPSLVSRRPELPAAVDPVLARAMAKVAEERYESCGDFAEALREALGLAPYHRSSSASAPPYPPPRTDERPEAAAPGYPDTADSKESRPTPSTAMVGPAKGAGAAAAAVIADGEPAAGPETTAQPGESAHEPGGLTAAADAAGTSDVLAPGQRHTAAADAAAGTSDVLAPGQRHEVDTGSGTVPADPQPSVPPPSEISRPAWAVTPATPSRPPRWPRRRRAHEAPKRPSSAVVSAPDAADTADSQLAEEPAPAAGSDERVGEAGLLTTATDHGADVSNVLPSAPPAGAIDVIPDGPPDEAGPPPAAVPAAPPAGAIGAIPDGLPDEAGPPPAAVPAAGSDRSVGKGLPAAAAAVVAESQRTGDLRTTLPPDEPGLLTAAADTDALAPVQPALLDPGPATTPPAAAGDDLAATAATPARPQPAGDLGTTGGSGQSASEPGWLTVPGLGGDGARPAQRPPRRRGRVTGWVRRHRLPVFALACTIAAAAATLPFISPSSPGTSRPLHSPGPSTSPRPVAAGTGWVSLGNLSEKPSPADIYLYPSGSSSPQLVQHDVAYGTILSYQAVHAGYYSVEVRPAGSSASSNPVWSVSLTVQPGGMYTVAPLRATAQRGQLKVIDNNLTAPTGKSFVRVIQADIDQGQVTFHCSCAAGTPGNIITDAAPGTVSSQAAIPAGTWTMTATGPSATTSLPVTLTAGTVHTEIIISKPGGGLEIINLVDGVPSYRLVPVDLPPDWRSIPITSLAFSPSGATLAIDSLRICLWDIAARGCASSFGSASVYSVAFSPDGTTLAAGDRSGDTYLYNVLTRSQNAVLTDRNMSGVLSVAFSHNGKILAVGDSNGRTYLWNVATTKLIAILPDPDGKEVSSVAFSPDGKILAAAGSNGTYLWNVATGKLIVPLPDPDSKEVSSVAFSLDGKLLVAGDKNGRTYVWNVATRTLIADLLDPGGKGVISVACSPDDTTIAAGDNNSNTYVWNVITRKLIEKLADPNNQEIDSVAFNANGTALAIGDNNGNAFLWNISLSA